MLKCLLSYLRLQRNAINWSPDNARSMWEPAQAQPIKLTDTKYKQSHMILTDPEKTARGVISDSHTLEL